MTKISSRKFHQVINQVPADYYDKGVKNNFLQRFLHTRKWLTLDKFLKGSKGKLLDIGCADGTNTEHIHKAFPNLTIVGIDYYEKAINYAKETKPKIKFVTADAHELPFRSNYFDTVTAIEVLEHLHKPQKALKEIYRVLKPGGYLVIGQDTDSLLFRTVWWLWTKWKGSVWAGSHINCSEPKEIILLLQKNDFLIKRIKYLNLNMEIFIKAKKPN